MKKVLAITSVLLMLSPFAMAGGNADIVVKWGGPSGQGKMIFWNPATGNTNLVLETNGNITVYGTATMGSCVTGGVTYLGCVQEAGCTNTGIESVGGNTTLAGTLTVTGATKMVSTEFVAGAVTFGSTLYVSNTVTMDPQTNSTVFIGLPATVQAAGILWNSNGYVRCGP